MLKNPHLKFPTESKLMQVLKLCKLAFKPRPHYCLEMIFSKCHILCSVISKQLKTAQLSFICATVVFYHIESFSDNKILKNVIIKMKYIKFNI